MQAHGSRTILATFTDHLLAQMAHELQHAIEVADDPLVVDGATLGAAYERWGFRPDPKTATYETHGAIRAAQSALQELRNIRQRSDFERAIAASTQGLGSVPRLRSTDAAIRELLSEGAERSTTFRGLVDTIAGLSGIVYVEFGHCAFGRLDGCMLPNIVAVQGQRYLKIVVTPDKHRRPHDQLIGLIAHELRHAVEVIAEERVVDGATLEALYQRIGTPMEGGLRGYETSAARAAEKAVLSELSATHAGR
jgi:hypothetical protein